VLSVTESINRN